MVNTEGNEAKWLREKLSHGSTLAVGIQWFLIWVSMASCFGHLIEGPTGGVDPSVKS